VFEALLAELWRGFSNATNFDGPNTIDDNATIELVRRLHDMLLARRKATALSREEFDAIAALSWLHLTVIDNTRG
jgi:hypothetical protein